MSQIELFYSLIILSLLVPIMVFVFHYKKPSPEKAIVIFGVIDPKKNRLPFIIHRKKAVFVWPMIQKYYYLPLDAYKLELEANVKFMDHRAAIVKITGRIMPDKENLDAIVDNYFKKTKKQVELGISKKN